MLNKRKRHSRTIDGRRYQVSDLQVMALSDKFVYRKEGYADLGLGAMMVLRGLVTQGLMVETTRGWKRTATGGRLYKLITADRNNNSKTKTKKGKQ